MRIKDIKRKTKNFFGSIIHGLGFIIFFPVHLIFQIYIWTLQIMILGFNVIGWLCKKITRWADNLDKENEKF